MLEKALTPQARVFHDVRLPNLRTGHACQCDIVIRYGATPRETMAIVEVQDRSARVTPNDFRGWVRKREDVGAQHLICVSALPFPQSIIDDVKMIGPTVRLVTLRQLERSEWPDGLGMTYLHYAHARCTIDERSAPVLLFPTENPLGERYALPNREKLFIRDGEAEARSLVDLLDEHSVFTLAHARRPPGTYAMVLDIRTRPPLFLVHAGRRHPVALFQIPIVMEQKVQSYPLVCSSYEQVDIAGALAWAVTTGGEFGGKQFEFRAIFMPTETGAFRLDNVALVGAPGRSVCWFGGKAMSVDTSAGLQAGRVPPPQKAVPDVASFEGQVFDGSGTLLGAASGSVARGSDGPSAGARVQGSMLAGFVWPDNLGAPKPYLLQMADGRRMSIVPVGLEWDIRGRSTRVKFVGTPYPS